MTKKQMKKLAQEIASCQKVHDNLQADKEDVYYAENRMLQITNQIMRERNGFEVMLEIDSMVQEILQKEKGEN